MRAHDNRHAYFIYFYFIHVFLNSELRAYISISIILCSSFGSNPVIRSICPLVNNAASSWDIPRIRRNSSRTRSG